MPHKFDPAHLANLDRPDRAEWQPVDAFLGLLQPKAGGAYADIGAGVGYFAIPVAERIASEGKVYALDVQQEMLDELARRLRDRGISNVILLRSEEHRIPLPAAHVDAAWSVNTFHEFEAPLALLYEVRRIVKPSGRVFLVDWKPVETPMGPPIEERVPPERVREALRAAGFPRVREHGIYRHHYVLEAVR